MIDPLVGSLIRLRDDDKIQITRLYRESHEPLPGFEEDVRADFVEYCERFGDDAATCQIHGHAYWAWLKLGPAPRYRATEKDSEFREAFPVTVIKVYRKRGTKNRG